MMRRVLSISAKSPKVIMESGKVRIIRIGRIKVLIAPNTTAKTRAGIIPSTDIPGKI
jgi:hypothetical protein